MPKENMAFNDALGHLPHDSLSLLGGSIYEVGYQDGVLADLARARQIWYRARYPKGFTGPAAIILISHGGIGSEVGHTLLGHLGTAYAGLGFLAINIGHMVSANEMQHRYDRPLDVSFMIDALARTAAAADGTPFDAEEALPLPPDFTGVPEQDWLGQRIRGQQMLDSPIGFAAFPDVNRIGVAGHSFGAFAAHAVAGAEHSPTMGIRSFRDPRVDAIVPIATPFNDRYGYFDKGPDNNSWKDIEIPSYVLLGDQDLPQRRRPFDCYRAVGDKFLSVGKDQGHNAIAGGSTAAEDAAHFVALNTALFFHVYLRGGNGRDDIGALARLDGWTLERKLEN